MLRRFHEFWLRVLTPIARFFLRIGVGPDIITLIGTCGVCAAALGFYPRGELFWGTVVVTTFVFSDMLDGLMARTSGRSSSWGAFLDSTLDRLGDAAVFGGLALWYAAGGDNYPMVCVTLYALVMGSLTSYAKARAESLGLTANVGIAERADRLVAVLIAAGLSGLGVPYLLPVVLCGLAVASTVTVIQRMLSVRSQALRGRDGGTTAGAEPTDRDAEGNEAATGEAVTGEAVTGEAVTGEVGRPDPSDDRADRSAGGAVGPRGETA